MYVVRTVQICIIQKQFWNKHIQFVYEPVKHVMVIILVFNSGVTEQLVIYGASFSVSLLFGTQRSRQVSLVNCIHMSSKYHFRWGMGKAVFIKLLLQPKKKAHGLCSTFKC